MYRMFVSGNFEKAANVAAMPQIVALLASFDIEVINPLENLEVSENGRFCDLWAYLDLLGSCDGVYLTKDWFDSNLAAITELTAKRSQMDIWHEEMNDVERIQKAIIDVTGLRLADYSTQSRCRVTLIPRCIFTKYCRDAGMTIKQIGRLTKRDHSTVIHSLDTYDDNMKYDKEFRDIARKVDAILNPQN